MEVPGARRLAELVDATFLSFDDLGSDGEWLRVVVDTFALDPGELSDPCGDDYTDDRLQVTPFLRLQDGYRVVLPLDLAITIRFHLLRFAKQEGQLLELGERWRDRAVMRVKRAFGREAVFEQLDHGRNLSRYLTTIEGRDLHVIVATDPLVDPYVSGLGESTGS